MRSAFIHSIISILFFFSLDSNAQECGTQYHGGENISSTTILAQSNLSRSSEFLEIPVLIHILRINNEAPILYEDIIEELEKVNVVFEPTGYQFISCAPNYIDEGDGSQEIVMGFNDQTLHEKYMIPGSVNIYFVENIRDYCGFSAFPWYFDTQKKIFMDNQCLTGGTFEHELGHFFGLFHTHEDYYGDEYVDGSNCLSAGDKLCDTEADPILGWNNVNSLCNYTGIEVDPKGQFYNPDPSNLMSYARHSCRNFFSDEQFEKMEIYLESSGLSFEYNEDFDLNLEVDDNFEFSFGETIEVNIRIDGDDLQETLETELTISLVNDYSSQKLEHIELSLEPNESLVLNQSIDLPSSFTGKNQSLVFNLNPNQANCEFNLDNNIRKIDFEHQGSIASGVSFYPNPASDFVTAYFEFPNQRQYVNIDVFNSVGQLVISKREFAQGPEYFRVLKIAELIPGIYTARFAFANEDEYVMRFEKL